MPGRAAAFCAVALALVALAAGPAQAHPESAAASLRPDVVRVWHQPDPLAAHMQWQGFLRLAPGTNVSSVSYQICQVGRTCFAPPAPAHDDGQGTFRFDTTQYTVNGRPVDYEPGWRLGVKWFLVESRADGNVTVEFPRGPDLGSDACSGDAALSCAEAHYLAFDLPPAPKKAPGIPMLPGLGLAVALALLRRRL